MDTTYTCVDCLFSSKRKSEYTRHLSTKKHARNSSKKIFLTFFFLNVIIVIYLTKQNMGYLDM